MQGQASEDPLQACPPLTATPQTSFLLVAPAGGLARFVLLHPGAAAVHASAVLKVSYDDDSVSGHYSIICQLDFLCSRSRMSPLAYESLLALLQAYDMHYC